jgi:hypothetical protein
VLVFGQGSTRPTRGLNNTCGSFESIWAPAEAQLPGVREAPEMFASSALSCPGKADGSVAYSVMALQPGTYL